MKVCSCGHSAPCQQFHHDQIWLSLEAVEHHKLLLRLHGQIFDAILTKKEARMKDEMAGSLVQAVVEALRCGRSLE